MKKFVIVTDSCSDLYKELRDQYDIDYIPMHFTVEGKDYMADLDWKELSAHEFYDLMRQGIRIKTAQVNLEQYLERFRKYLEEGYDILSISCSSALSASVRESEIAREELLKIYPQRKIICIDGLNASLGLGLLCITASMMRDEGKSMEEIADWISQNKKRVNQEATVEKLTYLKQSGRVSAASAFFGGILSIKPIIISDVLGRNVAVEKVKGRQGSLERLLERFKEEYEKTPYQKVFIVHGDHLEDAIKLKEMLLKVVPEEDISIGYVGPCVGATTGPGTISIYFYGKEVTHKAE